MFTFFRLVIASQFNEFPMWTLNTIFVSSIELRYTFDSSLIYLMTSAKIVRRIKLNKICKNKNY